MYSLAILSPGTLNPLGVWNQFRGWLRDDGDVLALLCILIFCSTTPANVQTILIAAVKAGPRVAADVGRPFYNNHRHTFWTTMQEHKNNTVSKPGAEADPHPKMRPDF